MTKVILAGAALAALVSVGAARAQSCAAGCNTQHSSCARAGKDYATCMGAWRQCKAACLTPVRTSSAPPRATQVAVRR